MLKVLTENLPGWDEDNYPITYEALARAVVDALGASDSPPKDGCPVGITEPHDHSGFACVFPAAQNAPAEPSSRDGEDR